MASMSPFPGRRTKYQADVSHPQQAIVLARGLFKSGEFLKAFDVYELIAARHQAIATDVLAEVYDCYQQLPGQDRYNLYQARIFDFNIQPGDKILDVGSGNYPVPFATHLADFAVEDDAYGRAGEPFKYLEGKPVFQCDIEQMPFKDKEFDFVYCSHVLEHVNDPAKACRELMRIAKRGYIETPTRGKDIWLNTAKISNHLWTVENVYERLIFTEYNPYELEGFKNDILLNMHVAPQTNREKAFSALLYLKADLINTMLLWEDSFEFEVRRKEFFTKEAFKSNGDAKNTISEVFKNNAPQPEVFKTAVPQAENPNSISFYDNLYAGTFVSGTHSGAYEYEVDERIEWYREVAQLPFFKTEGILLDVGCGMGGLLEAVDEVSPLYKYGIDFSKVGIDAARGRVFGEFTIGDVRKLPYKDNYFDRVAATEVLEHIEQPEEVLAEIYRVTKPGGKILITVPEESQDLKPEEWPGGIDLHINKFTEQSLAADVAKAGFTVENIRVGRELWLVAEKPKNAAPVLKKSSPENFLKETQNIQKGNITGNSCLFINTYYPAFLDALYREKPHIAALPYEEQLKILRSENFGDSDFYSVNLLKAGFRADDIIANCAPLQQAWARENGFKGSGLEIVLEQVRRFKSDVVYFQDLALATPEFLKALRPHVKLIAGQIASPMPESAHLAGFDIIISSFPHFVERFRKAGITTYYQPLAFEPRIAEYTSRLFKKYEVTFIGGISAAHAGRKEFLEKICAGAEIDVWGYGAETLPADSPVLKKYHGQAWGMTMFSALAESRMTVNYHIDVAENYANNMRLFEATGCGALLITDYKDNVSELFEIGKEVVAYRSPEECLALIEYYRLNPEEAAAIARAGQMRTLRDHTYEKRMEQTAEILKRHLRYLDEKHEEIPQGNISYGYVQIDRQQVSENLTSAWQSESIPQQQRALVQKQLGDMYKGRVAEPFSVLAALLKGMVTDRTTILETGCASGYYYEALSYLLNKKLKYTGADYSDALIAMAKNYYPQADFVVADGAKLPFKNAEFDIVVSGCVLLHVPNYAGHIAETVRVAKHYVVAHRTPVCRRKPTQYMKKFAYGIETVELIFNEEELIRLFKNEGLELLKMVEYISDVARDEYHCSYLFKKRF